MDADLIEEQSRHEAGHTPTKNGDLLVLLAGDEGGGLILGFEVGDTVEPGTVGVVDGGEGVALAGSGMADLEGNGAPQMGSLGEGVETLTSGELGRGEPDKASADDQ